MTNQPVWTNHASVDIEKLTPSMRHYVELKQKDPNHILMYRLGDFFECFFEDAIKVSKLLGITLTSKEAGKEIGRIPMAGVPHHSITRYCAELVNQGLSIALCDQVESSPAKGELLRREITRIFTPGTVIEESMLPSRENSWLIAVVVHKESWGLAVADVSTGSFKATEGEKLEQLYQEIAKFETAEVLWSGQDKPNWCPENFWITHLTRTPFEFPQAQTSLLEAFHLANLEGLGLNNAILGLRAAGGLIHYLNTTRPASELNNETAASLLLDTPSLYFSGNQLVVDQQTRRNLELTRTQRNNEFQGSLLWAIDQTLTAMGGRCLRQWFESPLTNLEKIRERQEAIGELINKRSLRLQLRQLLKSISDLERLAGRSSSETASPKELINLSTSLESLPILQNILKTAKSSLLLGLNYLDPILFKIATLIKSTLINDPPLNISEGGLIQSNRDEVLDELRKRLDEQNTWLVEQEQVERVLSGNANVKLQHHRNFGYYLAVTRSKAESVPNHWIRRQTLKNEERFVTSELKAREGKIFKIKTLINQREHELFCELRRKVGEQATIIRATARQVATLDTIAGLSEIAANKGYCCPEMVKGRILKIELGRHPVVEQLLVDKHFVANNIHLGEDKDLVILTGPNASGKSCYLRQTGVLQLMAQMGSWIPAEAATLGIADRIFTRVGAVDDLGAGQSTFMVEMAETANILNYATDQSLVLLDEIGRGTATFDGLSIASAVAEYLAKKLKSRSIFATHYHELNRLESSENNIKNSQVLVKETGENLIFLYKVVDGGASRSYGIEVARLAGVPLQVITRAREILKEIEGGSNLFSKNG